MDSRLVALYKIAVIAVDKSNFITENKGGFFGHLNFQSAEAAMISWAISFKGPTSFLPGNIGVR